MNTLGMNTGIGCFTSLGEKVREGLQRCRTNNVLNCGNCPYAFLRKDGAIDECTSVLANDAEEYIDSLLGDHICVMGLIESDSDYIRDLKDTLSSQ